MAVVILPEHIEKAKAHKAWHPFADLFPLMDPEDDGFKTLLSSVEKSRGVKRAKIETWNDEVFDGRHRQVCCIALGIEPEYKPLDFPDEGAALAYVWSMKMGRQHLSPSQKAMAAAKIQRVLGEDGGDRTKRAAEIADASERTTRKAAVVIEKGTPALVEAVESGQVTINDAEKILDLPAREQNARVKRVVEGKAKHVSTTPPPKSQGKPEAEWIASVVEPYNRAAREIKRIIQEFDGIAEDPGVRSALPWTRMKVDLSSALAMFEHNKPAVYCCGNDADAECVCRGAGYLTQHQFDDPKIREKHAARKR